MHILILRPQMDFYLNIIYPRQMQEFPLLQANILYPTNFFLIKIGTFVRGTLLVRGLI
jgi:hypothetical protein